MTSKAQKLRRHSKSNQNDLRKEMVQLAAQLGEVKNELQRHRGHRSIDWATTLIHVALIALTMSHATHLVASGLIA
jgi:hypothetical protein